MQRQWVIAGAFGLGWLLLMLAGSDFPPPVGFLWVILGIALLVRAIGWGLPRLWRVQAERGPGPVIRRCLGAGAALGLVLAPLLTILTPPDSSGPEPTTAAFVIWVIVLVFLGLLNGALVGAVAVLATPRD